MLAMDGYEEGKVFDTGLANVNPFHGSVISPVILSRGKFGIAPQFDSSSCIVLPNTPSSPSIMMWLMLHASSFSLERNGMKKSIQILSKVNDYRLIYQMSEEFNTAEVIYLFEDKEHGRAIVPTNQWFHFAIVGDERGSNVSLFINGI
jgi:hypothetical protein